MKLKLFEVEVTTSVIVLAVDEGDAERVARDSKRDIDSDSEWEYNSGREITSLEDAERVGEGWSDSLPYAEPDAEGAETPTVRKVLESLQPGPERCKKTFDMFTPEVGSHD